MQCADSLADVVAPLGAARARARRQGLEIARAIEARHLTQDAAADVLGIDPSKVSRIMCGRFRGVSETKRLELVARLGRDVKIVVGPVRRRAGRIEREIA